MIIPPNIAIRMLVSSPSSGMYKIEHRSLYKPTYNGLYVNGIPTLTDNGHPLYWIDKTEPVYTDARDKGPLCYLKLNYIYIQSDVREAPVQDVLREGYENSVDFYTAWCKLYDPTTLTNKRYGLAKMHKRKPEFYQALVLGIRPIATSVDMRHPLMKNVQYDPDLVDIFHNYMPALDTDQELIAFLFADMF